MQIVSQEWWEVRDPQTRETGFVPGRCLNIISREEEHLYQAGKSRKIMQFSALLRVLLRCLTVVVLGYIGVVWSGALLEKDAARHRSNIAEDQQRPKEGKLSLEDLASMDLLELKAELRRRGDVHPRGDVRRLRAALERMIRTENESSVARQDTLPPCFGELTVTIRSCQDLMPTHTEYANPYVVITLGTEDVVKKRTTTHTQTLAPEIGEEFHFTIPDYSEIPEHESEAQMRDRVSRVAAECVLSVVVWDAPKGILESPCFLGEVKVDLVKEFGKEWLTQEISREFKLSDPDFRSETEHRERRLKARGSHFHDQLELGYVDLGIRFRRKEQTKPWWSGGALDGVLDMASVGLDLTMIFQPKLATTHEEIECDRMCPNGHRLLFRIEDGLTAAERAMLPPCDGLLQVTVVSCSNLLPTDSEDHCSDPFVSVSLPVGVPKLQRTKTIKKTLQPVFDQTLTWKVAAKAAVPRDLVLSLTVFDAYLGGLAANFLGEAELDLCKFYRKRWLSGKLSKTLHLDDVGRDDGKKLKNDAALHECSKREAMSLRPYGTITLHVEFVATGAIRDSEENQAIVQSDGTSVGEAEYQFKLAAADELASLASFDDFSTDAASTEGVAQKLVREAPSVTRDSPLTFCMECFEALAVGMRLWECVGCNFVLCAACAAKQLDWADLDDDKLTFRLEQAQQATSARGFDDATVLARTRALISRAEEAGVACEAMALLRTKLMEYVENSRPSVLSNARLPMLSPAEARRRRERQEPAQNPDSIEDLPASASEISARLCSVQARLATAKASARLSSVQSRLAAAKAKAESTSQTQAPVSSRDLEMDL
jgi:hypothetical protein